MATSYPGLPKAPEWPEIVFYEVVGANGSLNFTRDEITYEAATRVDLAENFKEFRVRQQISRAMLDRYISTSDQIISFVENDLHRALEVNLREHATILAFKLSSRTVVD